MSSAKQLDVLVRMDTEEDRMERRERMVMRQHILLVNKQALDLLKELQAELKSVRKARLSEKDGSEAAIRLDAKVAALEKQMDSTCDGAQSQARNATEFFSKKVTE